VDKRYVDSAIRQALGRSQAENSGACPDQNQAAAYLEGRLRDDDKRAFEAHAADCEVCRQVLALALRLEEESEAVNAIRAHSSRRVLFRISIPVSALALIVAGVAIGILFLRSSKTPDKIMPTAQITELRAPAPVQQPSREKDSKESVSPAPAKIQKPTAVKTTVSRSPAAESAKKAEPAQDALLRATPIAATAGVPAELAELDAVKTQTRQVAAAKTEFAPARSEDVVARQALQSSGVVGGLPGGVVGGVVGGISPAAQAAKPQKVSMLNLTPTPREAIRELSRMLGANDKDGSRKAEELKSDLTSENRFKRIGDRSFLSTSGYWIDELCARNADAPIVEVRAGTTEFEEIMKLYPDLRDLRPVVIYWNDKILVMR
jgi:hypothetical protein